MTTDTETRVTTQVYRVYIRATPQAIWDAITKPEWSERYGYGGRVDYDLRPGGTYRAFSSEEMKQARAEMGGSPTPDVIVDGEVIESDPPHRLVQTWRMLMDPETTEEGFTRLTYEIDETRPGVSKLTLTHELEGAPKLATFVGGDMESIGAGGGWAEVLSDLKTLLETGNSFHSA
ncbi:MAG TPA: SRPBCC family protein [Actinomycetota bacterium]|nr:SRPBCC family protein [Actinomycetota bacterium]